MAISLNVPDIRPAEETLADYLKRRERELIQQTAAIRGMLIPKEKQLEEVRQAMKAIGLERSYAEELKSFVDQGQDTPPPNCLSNTLEAAAFQTMQAIAEGLTIKDLILRALNDHFHLGATPSELSDYMKAAYGREIDRNSISPQLARLRDEGLVQNTNALSGKWEIVLRGNLLQAAAEIERKNINALSPSQGNINRRGR